MVQSWKKKMMTVPSKCLVLNPFTPRSDQHINSPYNSNTLSRRQVMRIKKMINYGILS